MFDYAHQFADADDIIIAAPYWDLGFPAQLKTYIENIYVPGIVSAYNDHGQSCGLCRARSLTYITTAGGAYDPRFSLLSDRYGQRILRYPRDPTYLCGVSRHLRQRPRGYSAVRN